MTHRELADLLAGLGATPRLLRHLELVTEVAADLAHALTGLGVDLDVERTLAGATAHDAGKIEHPEELDAPGSRHEPAGRALLLRHGVPADIAEVAVSHASWSDDTPLEALVVVLADKLWKGARRPEVELAVARSAARRANLDPWSLVDAVERIAERVALGADERLRRSRVTGV